MRTPYMNTFLRPRAVAVSAVLFGLLAASAWARTEVDRKPPTTEYHTFERGRPPPQLELKPGEAAVCVSNYGTAVQLTYSSETQRRPDGGYATRLEVSGVQLGLELKNDIWLPQDASPKLKAHEEGHRDIAEKLYNEVAERAAREAAKLVDGKTFIGQGKTREEAKAQADARLKENHQAVIEKYLDGTSRAGRKIQEAYDRITVHGTRMNLSEADAIQQAWAENTPPLAQPPGDKGDKKAATKPATATKATPRAKR